MTSLYRSGGRIRPLTVASGRFLAQLAGATRSGSHSAGFADPEHTAAIDKPISCPPDGISCLQAFSTCADVCCTPICTHFVREGQAYSTCVEFPSGVETVIVPEVALELGRISSVLMPSGKGTLPRMLPTGETTLTFSGDTCNAQFWRLQTV
jgi:hypothetical protein